MCVFLGYPSGYKGFKVLHIDKNQVFVTRNVIFHEDTFPFKDDTSCIPAHSSDIFDNTVMPLPIPVIIGSIPHVSHVVHLDTHTPNVIPVVEETVPLSTGQGQLLSGRARRTVKTPSYLSQYHCSLARSSCLPSTLDSSSIPSLPSSNPYHISYVLTYSHFTPLYQSYILSYYLETEPTSFRQAMLSPNFRKATN